MNATDLRATLEERLSAVEPPAGDVERTQRAGRAIRRRRRAGTVLGAAAVVTAIAVAASQLSGPGAGSRGQDGQEYASLGPLDFAGGARAYADPGTTVFLGGRSFPVEDLDYLDTDAAATAYGIVFFDDGRPMLLDERGEVSALVDGPVESPRGFHPTAKADSTAPLLAWATLRDGTATITVRDMESGDDVAETQLDCGTCDELVIDAIDGGVVFVRTEEGTRTWDSATDEWSDFAGPRTQVADVRNGVVLHDGPAPAAADGWRLVKGATDAQLTFDGRHVLSWSSRLEPTDPQGSPIQLEVGQPRQPGDYVDGFFAVDTDGSILVAHAKRYPDFTVYDCEVPSGACTELGPLTPTSGDPMFIGNDM